MNNPVGGLVSEGFICARGIGSSFNKPLIQINVNEVANGFTVSLGYINYVAMTKDEIKELIARYLDKEFTPTE